LFSFIFFRVIPNNYYKEKKILSKEVTDSLYNEVNNRGLDTKSKGLRSKKAKQSYIVLDDYTYESEGMVATNSSTGCEKKKASKDSVGKSPIDSLFGLVESIDSNIGVAQISPDQHKQNKAESQSHKMKTDGELEMNSTGPFINKTNSKRVESVNKSIKTAMKIENTVERVRATKRPIALTEEAEEEDSDNEMESLRKLVKVKTPPIVKSIQEENEKSASPSPSIKPLMTTKTPDDKKKRRRKKITYHPKHQRRMLKIAAENNKAQIIADKIIKIDAIPILKIEKTATTPMITTTTTTTTPTKKIQRKPLTKQKRVDPIALALKNIKNREKTRRRQRLTRRGLSISPNDLLRKAERNTEENENDNGNDNIKNKRKQEKPLLLRSVTRSVAAKISQAQMVGVSTRNSANRRPIDSHKKLYLLKAVKKRKVAMPVGESGVKPTSQSKTENSEVSPDSGDSNNKTSAPSDRTTDIDLTCHENVDISSISPLGDDMHRQVVPQQQQPKKNRRKPLKVFKSLPNDLVSEEYKDLKDSIEGKPVKKIEQESQQQGTEEIKVKVEDDNKSNNSVSIDTLSPRLIAKSSNSELFERPYKITIARMNRPTLIPRRYLDSQFAPAYQTLVQQPMLSKPSPLKHLQKPGAVSVARRPVDLDIAVTDTSPSSSTVTSPCSDGVRPSRDNNDKNDTKKKQAKEEKSPREKSSRNATNTSDNSNDSKNTGRVKKRKKQAVFDFQETLKPLSRSNKEIRIGDIVWGKIFGYGWWPGKVLSNVRDSESSVRRLFCTWMGSNTNSTMSIEDLELFLPNFEKRFDVKKSAHYTKAVVEAQHCCKKKYGLK